ncbi:hypothetical protein ACOMHN_044389 [Nucella lapillus]
MNQCYSPVYRKPSGQKHHLCPPCLRHHPDFLYIGSSVNLRHRWSNHKSDCKLRKGHKCHVAQHFLDKQHPVDPQFTCLRIFAIEAVHKKENLGSAGCMNDWVQFGRDCYAFVDERVTWTTAKTICSTLDAGLVQISSKAENDFVAAQMRSRSLVQSWLGMQDFLREGRWVDDTENEPLEYFNWGHGEPNNSLNLKEGGEDCAILLAANGKWVDYGCDQSAAINVVCEYQ